MAKGGKPSTGVSVQHSLIERADRIHAHLEAGQFDQADAEITAAVQEAQSIQDLAKTDRTVVEAVLGAYRDKKTGLGTHETLKKPEHIRRAQGVAFVREHMKALLANKPTPTPPTPAAKPTPASAPAPAPAAAPAHAAAAAAGAPAEMREIPQTRQEQIAEIKKRPELVQAIELIMRGGNDPSNKDDYRISDLAKDMGITARQADDILWELEKVWKVVIRKFRQPLTTNITREEWDAAPAQAIPESAAPVTPTAAPAHAAAAAAGAHEVSSAGPKATPAKIPEALRLKAHPQAVKIIETVIDLIAIGPDVAKLRANLEGRRIFLGKEANDQTETIRRIIKALTEIYNHKPPLLQDLNQMTDEKNVESRGLEIKKIIMKNYVNGVFKQILRNAKRADRQKARGSQSGPGAAPATGPAQAATAGPPLSGASAVAPHAPSGAPSEITILPKTVRESKEFKTLVEKIKEVRGNSTALAAAQSLTNIRFLQAIFVKRVDKVMTALQQARGRPFRTENKIKKAIEHYVSILDQLLRGKIVGPVSAPAPAAPGPAAPTPGPNAAAASTPAPSTGPQLHTNWKVIDHSGLRNALEKAPMTPADHDRVIQAWELCHINAEGCPQLKIFQTKSKKSLDTCAQFAEGKNPGDALMLPRAIENLLIELRHELTDETIKALEKEPDEKALRETLVGLYFNMENLTPKMQDLLKILEIDPSEADAGPERIHLTRVQSTIRKVLYEEIPKTIDEHTAGKDLKEKIRLLGQIEDMREIENTLTNVQTALTTLDKVINRLPEKFKQGLTTLKATSGPTPGAPAGPAATGPAAGPVVAPIAPPVAPLSGAAAGAAAPGTPGAAPQPATTPRAASDYPPGGREIKSRDVDLFMQQVLEDHRRFSPDGKNKDVVSAALQKLIISNSRVINLAELELFLKQPDLETNLEITRLQGEDTAALRRLEIGIAQQITRTKDAIDRANRRAATHGVGADERQKIEKEIQQLYDGGADENGTPIVGLHQLEDQARNIKIAVQLKTGNRRYDTPREVMAMVHIYLRRKRGQTNRLTMPDISEEMEKQIRAEHPEQRKVQFNWLKPTLEDTLSKLGEKDDYLKKIGPEKMAELAHAHDQEGRVKDWIENLEGSTENHYKRTVPRLIAYLEFALQGARLTYLNSFSQERAKNLIKHLRNAHHENIRHRLATQVQGLGEAAKMVEYFKELEKYTVEANSIKKEIITRNANIKLAVGGLGGAAALGTTGASLLFFGPFAPIALGALGAGALAKGAGSTLSKTTQFGKSQGFRSGTNRIMYRSAVATAASLAPAAVLGLTAGPAIIMGTALAGMAAFTPELWKNRHNAGVKWLNRGLLTAGTLGLYAAYEGAAYLWSKRKK